MQFTEALGLGFLFVEPILLARKEYFQDFINEKMEENNILIHQKFLKIYRSIRKTKLGNHTVKCCKPSTRTCIFQRNPKSTKDKISFKIY